MSTNPSCVRNLNEMGNTHDSSSDSKHPLPLKSKAKDVEKKKT